VKSESRYFFSSILALCHIGALSTFDSRQCSFPPLVLPVPASRFPFPSSASSRRLPVVAPEKKKPPLTRLISPGRDRDTREPRHSRNGRASVVDILAGQKSGSGVADPAASKTSRFEWVLLRDERGIPDTDGQRVGRRTFADWKWIGFGRAYTVVGGAGTGNDLLTDVARRTSIDTATLRAGSFSSSGCHCPAVASQA